MFSHKSDIAEVILAASEDLRSCPTNAWLGQPVTHLIHKPAKEVVQAAEVWEVVTEDF